jgi:hypothetical protein
MKIHCAQICMAAATVCLLAAARSGADVLELKNGRVLTGQYVGGTAGTVRFETAGGVQVIEASQALALTFTGVATPVVASAPATPAPITPAPAASVAAAPAAAPAAVAVPAGTVLLVRMVDGATSHSPQGQRFATVLETDLVINGLMVSKAGAKVYGRVAQAKQAGRMVGKSMLDLRLCELCIGGTLVSILTGPYALGGAGSLGKTAKGAAAGAAIGAMAGDTGKGAAIGALASGLKRGQPLVVPPGTLLEFEIQQPVTISLTR